MAQALIPAPTMERPRVVSVCGTWLKPEMQSIYRQVTGLRRHESVVFTEQVQHGGQFPWDPVVTMTKLRRPRPRGNFLLRFWYKHVVKQWPPPRAITKEPEERYYPYNLPALLRAWQPALVHVYYGHKAVKYLEMVEEWGGRWVVSFHGVDVVKFTEDPEYVRMLREVFAKAALVLARSESLLEELNLLGCPESKLRLNRTPVPVERFPVVERRVPEDGEWRLVQACRLIGKKGLYTTLEALVTVVREFPRVKFVVCGTGPENDRLRERAEALGLSGHVELKGWQSQEQLLEEYRRGHVFLHPSELTANSDQEGIPNSMLEAMATGLPVVATEHGGIPEAVTHGVDGLLVPEKAPEMLAGAILEVLRDPGKWAALGAAAAATVRERFCDAASLESLEAAYEEARAEGEAGAGEGSGS
jgi:glycosyltransferase involved in cell wall biosynthesis